ncbi:MULTISPECIES: nitroreductase [unclassified Crossiella]|uniref:nitroreductase n=1 Tax=unclassified Crossiella TaxID=2620835 RepID=UPI001FFE5005|nr:MULTISPECIES: nitroreductase [unclassified Crossiella]MCK2237442.1 nitroreductase [Crossiella sp. S99.2]MCK2251097.1 nitroreductase [Crossiella sp. S99.1]
MTTGHLPEYAEHLIRARRATRAFRPDPVPAHTLRAVFSLAGAAPSNSNTQPWQVEVVSGAARDRLGAALVAAHTRNDLSPDFPYREDLYQGAYQRRRQCAGERLYAAVGIGRADHAARAAYNAQSLRFYGAPHVALLFTPANAEVRIAADVGIYAQTLMLAMTAYGIASCPQGLLSFYADTIRAELGVRDRKVLLGISFGYAEESAPANTVRVARAELAETTRFHS